MSPDPIEALHARPGGALALLIRTEGGFPRRPGAMMALWPDGRRVGRLGAGCIDADIAAHLRETGAVTHLTYGRGGPVDLPLPCGGTVGIALIHDPDPDWIAEILRDRARRRSGQWTLDLSRGTAIRGGAGTGMADGRFNLILPPPPVIHLHGEGDEAEALASLARAVGVGVFEHPERPAPDAQTAVVTLFHDHDRELGPLKQALASPAFFVGALGSRRAQAARIEALRQQGCDPASLARLKGPIGVLAPVREPRLLAASVLTQILAEYEAAQP